MAYFHQSICISPQFSFPESDLTQLKESENNLLLVKEPDYPGIPAGVKRRMGKSVRMAVGAAIPLLEKYPAPDGMMIATANGGMEDCIKFLNQIIEYNEGLLTPGNFVQSTSNAAAAQIAMITKNHNYNITHVHRGIAFENALMDVVMALKEHPDAGYLLGCTDEISAYNYNIDSLAGWFRKEPVSNTELLTTHGAGTIPGEGSFMTWMDNKKENASASLEAVKTIHTEDPQVVLQALKKFMADHLPENELPDLLLTGENGDDRLLKYYETVESFFPKTISIARFKHLCGDYCTASSFAVWLSIQMLKDGIVLPLLIKNFPPEKKVSRILIYNNYRGAQHGFMLLSGV